MTRRYSDLNTLLRAPVPSADYISDCRAGREYGDRVALVMANTDNPAVLAQIAKFHRPEEAGIRAGFFTRMGEHIIANMRSLYR